MTTGGSPAVARLGHAALWAATGLALAGLPGEELPPAWLAAFLLPALLLGAWRAPQRAGWHRALLATALQVLACSAVALYGPPLSRPAALAGTILPPLGFVVARRGEHDAALGLFLSFCVLLVGAILAGPQPGLLLGYGLAACLALRCEAHRTAHQLGNAAAAPRPGRPAGAVRQAATALGLALPCLLVALAIDTALAALPAPGRPGGAPAPRGFDEGGRRTTGLADSFVLDGGRGVLADLTGEQLVLVQPELGERVPDDLYLRSGFFAVAGLDRWAIGPVDTLQAGSPDSHLLRRPLPRAPVRWLQLERFAGARGFVFVPPGAVELRGVRDLRVDSTREWLREGPRQEPQPYLVAWQDLPPPPADLPFDPRAARLGLLDLPKDLDPAPFRDLLRSWSVPREPLGATAAIAAGLAARCRYDRLEPAGPFPHTLQNFLFAPGDRRGYCMHFAAAAAMLLRLSGIPCRIAVGLYGGAPDPEAPEQRIYGSQHAHAWLEIPFAGRGYVVFDPTPPAERGRATPSLLPPTDPADDVAPAAAGADRSGLAGAIAFATQPWVLGAALLLAGAALWWPGRRAGPGPVAATPRPAKQARRLLVRILRALGDRGLWRQRGQTLEQFAQALGAAGRLPAELAAAFRAYQEVRFGGRPFDAERERVLLAGLAAVEAMVAEPASEPEGVPPRPIV